MSQKRCRIITEMHNFVTFAKNRMRSCRISAKLAAIQIPFFSASRLSLLRNGAFFLLRPRFLIITIGMVRKFSACIFLSSFCGELSKGQGVGLVCGFRRRSQSFFVDSEAIRLCFLQRTCLLLWQAALISGAEQIFVANGGGKRLLLAKWIWKREVNDGVDRFFGASLLCWRRCLGLRQIVGEAVGFAFVDVASLLWPGCRRPAGVFLMGRSMWLRP